MSEGAVVASGRRRDHLRLVGGLAAALLLITAVILAVVGGAEEEPEPPSAAEIAPGIVSEEALVTFEELIQQPVYWLGPRPGRKLELAQEADGSVYVRYLPSGVEAGDPGTTYLTVGTYPVPDAAGALRRLAEEGDGQLERLADGAVLLNDPGASRSAYLAYRGEDLQVEVYHPQPGRAAQLVESGAVRPAG